MKIVFATGNLNKVRELSQIVGNRFEIIALSQLNIKADCIETGDTFRENSIQKAIYYSSQTEYPVIADDSGLEIDALNGEPGILSARYLSVGMSYEERCRHILERMHTVPADKRTARFRCVASCASDGHLLAEGEGAVEGTIAQEPSGTHGFGYDPIFYFPAFGKTFAQVPLVLKNTVSHRKQAFSNLLKSLFVYFNFSV